MSLILAAILSLASPSGPGAMAPHLSATRDGGVVMTWLEPVGKGHALRIAVLRGGRWTAPETIVFRDDFFVNWADFPSVVEDAKGTLFVHWLQKSGPGTYAYNVHVASSRDRGKTWSGSKILHADTRPAEHGFVSMVPLPAGGVGAAWLDGRNMTEGSHGMGHGEGAMTLRYAEVDASLRIANESMVDARVCECCGTGMIMTARGPLVAYRDRGHDELRDITLVRLVKGKWSEPKAVHNDGWRVPGCPVNGPQLDSRGELATIAWFTAPNNQPRVNVAFSKDGGATFGKPVRVDKANATGRVDVLQLGDGSALVTWIEGSATAASIMVRRVRPDGRMEAPRELGAVTAARASGFPRGALAGNSAYFAWTDPQTKQIRVARLDLK
jgi:hypothetical protein